MRKDSVRRLEQHGVMRIPEGWTQSRVKYLGAYINGYPFKPDDWGTVGRPILRIQDLSSVNGEPNRFDGEIPGRYLVRPRDILISWSASLGVYRWAGEEAWLNQHIFKVSLDARRVRDDFFVWLAEWFINEMDREVHGSTMQHLTADAFGGFPVLLPPHEEQARIADYLDRETARLDALVAAKERVLGLLAEKRRALITRAVTRGLDPRAPLRDSGIPWLGEIPAHWEAMRLKRLVGIPITDGPHETPEFAPDGIDFISAEAIQEDAIDFERRRGFITPELHGEYCRKTRPQRDDILFCKSGATTGKLARVMVDHDFSVWSPLAVIRADWGRALPAYLEVSLRADIVQDQVRQTWSAGTQPNIAMGAINELWLAAPPITEQAEILATLNVATSQCDKIKSATVRTVALLKERRAALIAAAVTGQLEVA